MPEPTLKETMPFLWHIYQQKIHYKENTGHEPRFLIIGRESLRDLTSEVLLSDEGKYSSELTAAIREGTIQSVLGLTIVKPGIMYGGSVEWALGH